MCRAAFWGNRLALALRAEPRLGRTPDRRIVRTRDQALECGVRRVRPDQAQLAYDRDPHAGRRLAREVPLEQRDGVWIGEAVDGRLPDVLVRILEAALEQVTRPVRRVRIQHRLADR